MDSNTDLSNPKKTGRLRKGLSALALLAIVLGFSGCRTLSFYAQAIKGQYQIFVHEEKIEKILANPETSASLKSRLELVQDLRGFAEKDLKLPVDNHYRKYVDVHRDFVVWNVEAAPEFSLQPKTWWYPLVGSLEYRGYFSKASATNYARYLRKKRYDVAVGGVQAYSTLGWFKDPVLNTFIFEPDADLAEIIIHELGHQRVFARGDTDFNEAFATTVGQEGARRYLKAKGDTAALDKYLTYLRRNTEFVHLIMTTRTNLAALYGDERNEGGKLRATNKNRDVPPEKLRAQKQQIMEKLKGEYATLKAGWGGDTEFDPWFAHEINNAHLNSVAAYYDFVPGFEQLLVQNGGDLEKFYQAAKQLSKMPKKERHEKLRELAMTRIKYVKAR
jgi:predicted aminopeptidase